VSFLDYLRGGTVAAMPGTPDQLDHLSEALRAEQETNLLFQESIADLELAAEDAGWRRLTIEGNAQFTREGLRSISGLCRLMACKNPLIKRGLGLRISYVWGQGVQYSARSNGQDGEQDVNAVIQAFLDDPLNQRVLTGQQAAEEKERALGTDGNVFLALFTKPQSGRVQVRELPWDEIVDVIRNPDDSADVWYYVRRWTQQAADPLSGKVHAEQITALYPDIHYRPRVRPRVGIIAAADAAIHWDAPVVHIAVNKLSTWRFGIGDAYAAIDWARAYKDFLEDWAKLVKALSRFAWRTTGPGSRTRRRAEQIAAAASRNAATGERNDVGATAVMDPMSTLEAIPKTGATIDSESGRPLAMMVASALGVPVTMLLGDPGQTGARATAETLDKPTELETESRRRLWTATIRTILDYVVDQAVKAPGGPLQGTVVRDLETDREVVTLAGDGDRTVDIVFPPLEDVDPVQLVAAIVAADTSGKVPALLVARLLMQALGVDDVDEWLAELTDENGNFIAPDVSAGDVAVQAFRNGQDPAAVVGSADTAPQPQSPGA
jgi:hypothetical protein